MQKRIVTIIIAALLLFCAGCAGTPSIAERTAYLSEKYADDTFKCVSSFQGSILSSLDTLYYESTSYPGRLVSLTFDTPHG